MSSDPLSGLPPAICQVECSGERHAIRWVAGDLVALNHGDAEGERALIALGGTSSACLDILGAWARQRENPALLTAISRGPGDQIQKQDLGNAVGRPRKSGRVVRRPAVNATGGSGWAVTTPLAGPFPATRGGQTPGTLESKEEDITVLTGLGREVTIRLAATISDTLRRQLSTAVADSPPVRPALEASLYGRASHTLRMWLGAPDLTVDLEVSDEPDEWTLTGGDADGPLKLVLPLKWVTEVWGRDMAIVAGRFALGVFESSGNRTTLTTIGPDLGAVEPLTIETS